jgi:hypothetical protein
MDRKLMGIIIGAMLVMILFVGIGFVSAEKANKRDKFEKLDVDFEKKKCSFCDKENIGDCENCPYKNSVDCPYKNSETGECPYKKDYKKKSDEPLNKSYGCPKKSYGGCPMKSSGGCPMRFEN